MNSRRARSGKTPRPKRLGRWRVALAIVAALALVAPFVIRHRASFYTDGQGLRSPRDSVQKVLRRVLWEPPRLVDPAVNDPALDDYEPAESPFGDLLVFTRGRPGENADLWIASRERGRWTRARPLAGINTAADELGAAFSPDGEWLYFYSNRPGGLGGYDIWASRRLPVPPADEPPDEIVEGGNDEVVAGDDGDAGASFGAWAEPVNLGPAINTAWNEMSPALDPRRGVLYFTSDRRPGGEGAAPWWSTVRSRLSAVDYDIYAAAPASEDAVRANADATDFTPATGFRPAAPLDGVNETPWAEGAVAVSPAGDFLYFSSNRPEGEGGFDLYRARLADEGPLVPETLGPTVNTAGDELDPALASRGFELYFARSRGGQEDLFVTVSREVFVDTEVGDAYWSLAAILEFLLDLLRRVPPSLLIVLAYILLSLLLLLLLKALWGERLGTLNLLTRCFLLALFIHLLLAIWMNRSEVERLVLEVFEEEERFEAFEVSVGGLPEETVGLAIREAVAATARDEPPVLTATMQSLARPSAAAVPRLAPSSMPEPARSAPPRIDRVRVEAPASEPSPAFETDDEPLELTLPEMLSDPADELERPELAQRAIEAPAPAPETARFPELATRPRAPPATSRGGITVTIPPPSAPLPAAAPPAELARQSPATGVDEGDGLGELDRSLARLEPALPPPGPALHTEVADGTPLPPPVLAERPANPRTPPPAGEREEDEPAKVIVRSGPIRPARAMRDSPAKSANTAAEWRPSARRALPERPPRRPQPDDLTSRLRPLDLPERPPEIDRAAVEKPVAAELAAARPVEATSTFAPRIYRLREGARREQALAESGGTDATEAAVRAGLAWLALHQSPDGRWTIDDFADHLESPSIRDLQHRSWDGRSVHDSRGGRGTSRAKRADTAATGLALLAFLGHGDTHLADGLHRGIVERGLRWLLSVQEENGDLRGGGNLYMHAIAAFALCEAYAFTRDPDLREPAQRAIDYTVRVQNPERGGWRYDPYPESRDVDTSVFGWMLMALKSGRLGGLDVDERALLLAARYLDSARMTRSGGRYAYQPGASRTSLAMTAQGYFSHQMLVDSLLTEEQKNDPELRRADEESIAYLVSNLPRAADMEGVNFYYWYYATLALFQEGGEPWEIWNAALSDLLVKLQVGKEHGTAYGSWDPRGKRARSGGRLYSTALSILCLEVYYRYARLRPR